MLRFFPGGNCCGYVCGTPFFEAWTAIDTAIWTVSGTNIYSISAGNLAATLPPSVNTFSSIDRCYSSSVLEDGFTLSLKMAYTFGGSDDFQFNLDIGTTRIIGRTFAGVKDYASTFPGEGETPLTPVPTSGDEIEIRIIDAGSGNCDIEHYINGVLESSDTKTIAATFPIDPDTLGIGFFGSNTSGDGATVLVSYTELTITY